MLDKVLSLSLQIVSSENENVDESNAIEEARSDKSK
jgi:hypothetical protein